MALPITWNEFEASIEDSELRRKALMYKASVVTNPHNERPAEDWHKAVEAHKPHVSEVDTYICSHCRNSSGVGKYVEITYFYIPAPRIEGRKCKHLRTQDIINYRKGG